MRIISGKNRGRKIHAPTNLPVRPTTDMAKESLFNILMNHFDFTDIKALDLFSGTGNIAYELVSRGCPDVTAVDLDGACIRFIKQISAQLNYSEIRTIQSDYQQYIQRVSSTFSLIFADPPYGMNGIESIPELILEHRLLEPGGWLILEHDHSIDFKDKPSFYDHRKYGKVNFSFFEA